MEIGFNLVSWNPNNNNPESWKEAVRQMHQGGLNSLTVVPYQFVNLRNLNLLTESVYGLASPPTNEQIASAIIEGKQLGMKVSLNPFVEIDNNSGIGHIWRGKLNFSGEALNTFFNNYQVYIINMAKFASDIGVERFYIGSELYTLTHNPGAIPLWPQLITDTRNVLNGRCSLSYAANYNEYLTVPFWDQLDEIGVDAYFPLAKINQAQGIGKPNTKTIFSNWKSHLKRLKKFSIKHKRPVIISEWGVVPYDLTTCEPFNWNPSPIEDLDEQLNAYQATIDAIVEQGKWLSGVQFWHWGMAGITGSSYGITPNSPIGQLISNYLANGRW